MPASTASITWVMMRLPPGAPTAITLSLDSRKLGVIELSMRLPAAGALAS